MNILDICNYFDEKYIQNYSFAEDITQLKLSWQACRKNMWETNGESKEQYMKRWCEYESFITCIDFDINILNSNKNNLSLQLTISFVYNRLDKDGYMERMKTNYDIKSTKNLVLEDIKNISSIIENICDIMNDVGFKFLSVISKINLLLAYEGLEFSVKSDRIGSCDWWIKFVSYIFNNNKNHIVDIVESIDDDLIDELS